MNPMQSPNTGVGRNLYLSNTHQQKSQTKKEKKKDTTEKFKTRGRLIIINNTEWRWSCGRQMITAYSEHGDKVTSPSYKVLKVSPDVAEHGKWKKTSDGMVTPKLIREWILTKLENSN